MSKESIAMRFTLVCSLMLFFVAGSVARPGVTSEPAPTPNLAPQADCSNDDAITDAIIARIRKEYTPAQIKRHLHFNLFTKNRVVEIKGDAHGINLNNLKEEKDKIIKIVLETDCVRRVITSRFTHKHGGTCGSNQQDCNGRCINASLPCSPLTP